MTFSFNKKSGSGGLKQRGQSALFGHMKRYSRSEPPLKQKSYYCPYCYRSPHHGYLNWTLLLHFDSVNNYLLVQILSQVPERGAADFGWLAAEFD
jgi:hypothetical protein